MNEKQQKKKPNIYETQLNCFHSTSKKLNCMFIVYASKQAIDHICEYRKNHLTVSV